MKLKTNNTRRKCKLHDKHSLLGGYRTFYLEDGGDTVLWNFGSHLQDYMTSQQDTRLQLTKTFRVFKHVYLAPKYIWW
jgi:hypothetical protein